jgi:Sulfotransferase domain
MALSIVGSGFGRTGTRSLKDALETLGFGPCHHMEEIFAHPEQVPYWQGVAAGEIMDWDRVFAGYRSQIDWPGAHVWQDLASAFPDAKVVHSHRPDDAWWASFSKTLGKLIQHYKTMSLPPHIRDMLDVGSEIVAVKTFAGNAGNREAALAAYHSRLEEVRAAIPAERLLVFDVAEGWEPLCRFLGVPVPDVAFPHRNSKDDFWANLGGEPA